MPKRVIWSKLKPAEKFLRKWNEEGFKGSDIAMEYQFDSSRKWRFDFAWPSTKVAVEIDGLGFGHQSTKGVILNNEKINTAILQGWLVLRYAGRFSHESASEAVHQTCKLIERRHPCNSA